MTFLFIAQGHLETTKVLIEKGANFFAKSSASKDNARSVLHLAVVYNQPDVVRYLISMKPGLINLRDGSFQTPMGVARSEHRQAIVDILSHY